VSNVETVQEIYAAFGRGDIPAVLERLAEDVEWEAWSDNSAQRAGVPWFQSRRGREGAGDFFAIVGTWDVREFSVVSILDGGDKVAAEIVIEAVPPGGEPFRDEEMHLWDFDADGLVKRMRHHSDTAKHMRAAGVEAG
jgi:uncharacterized protein